MNGLFNSTGQLQSAASLRTRYRSHRGITLLEVIIAMFIFLVGIVGVLAAMPSGVDAAIWVIFQDASLNLAHSKFSEFRRDRVNPSVDLVDGSAYMGASQEPPNASGKNPAGNSWHDFAHDPGNTYQYFDDISRYEWSVDKLDQICQGNGPGPVAPAGVFFPDNTGTPLNLTKVSIIIRMKGTTREMRFTQYMFPYDAP